MYVCVCQAVTDRQVREAAREGHATVRALRDYLGVAADCGKCARCAHDILRECRQCPGQEPYEACPA